jgi:hypothetical protein
VLIKEFEIFMEKFDYAANNALLIRLILSNNPLKSSDLKKITISPVIIKNKLKYSHLYTHKTKDIVKNYNLEETKIIIIEKLLSNFLNADLFTVEETVQLFSNKKMTEQKIKITEVIFKSMPALNHDRTKIQRIKIENNIYLKELNVTTEQGVLKKDMHDKFKQINKYLEIIDNLIKESGLKDKIKIFDMGSGKGYLTFALYDYLTNVLHYNPDITGIEIRQDLTDKCNAIAKTCNYINLNFVNSDIVNHIIDRTDILIALHACDTATDDAIFQGIKANSKLIVVAPCCHKQVRKQMNVTNELASIIKHGILKERQAELITDGIRALIAELFGYKTKVFEFISSEHTSKNLMIACIKHKSSVNREQIIKNIGEIKQLFGIEKHYLETLLDLKIT